MSFQVGAYGWNILKGMLTCLLTSAMDSCNAINMQSAPHTVVLSELENKGHCLLKHLTKCKIFCWKVTIVQTRRSM